jgi:serine/threonine protein kinase
MLPDRIDRYQIISECGRGGMAIVYRANDPQRQHSIALKVLPPEYLHDPQFRARFKREIDIHSNFRHPAVVPIYGYGQFQGQLYLVLRYMAGGSLEDRLREGKPMPLAEVLALLERISPALDEAHRRGIIHRDLKPSNILFDEQGQAYLSDFGIARLAEQASQLTGSNMLGSPAYMSPEQARTGMEPDTRIDLYSLGVMVYEMLTGKLPFFDSNPVKLALKHVSEPVPDILVVNNRLPVGCKAFMFKALAKKPSERFSSASEMTRALAEAAQPKGAPREKQPLPRERPPLSGGPRPRPQEPAPEKVPTPRPLKSAGAMPKIPSMPRQIVAKSSLPAFLRPFARYLRLPSWLRAPSVPYINLPAPLRRVLGPLGLPSTIALPKKWPAWVYVPLGVLVVMIGLIILVLMIIVLAFIYWLIFNRPASASPSALACFAGLGWQIVVNDGAPASFGTDSSVGKSPDDGYWNRG